MGSEIGQLTAGLGVIAVALVIGQYLVYRFVLTPERERCKEALAAEVVRSKEAVSEITVRADRLESEVRRQNEVLQEKALPALITATTAVGESQALLRKLQHESEIQQRALEVARKKNGGNTGA